MTPWRTRSSRPPVSITSARPSLSNDLDRRMSTYLILMGIRTACFLAMFIVPTTALKLVMLAVAVVLPAFAVLLANVGREKGAPPTLVEETEPRQIEWSFDPSRGEYLR